MHCDLRQLPFAANSIDLVVMPHVLEFYDDPHQILREVERILIPEGQIVLTGFNPYSLWGLRRRLPGSGGMFPWQGNISPLRRAARTGCSCSASRLRGRCSAAMYRPAVPRNGCIAGPGWNRQASAAGLASGGVYLLRAIKRVHSMRLILPSWQKTGRRAKGAGADYTKENPEPWAMKRPLPGPRRNLGRRRLPRQPWPRRLGRAAEGRCQREGNCGAANRRPPTTAWN